MYMPPKPAPTIAISTWSVTLGFYTNGTGLGIAVGGDFSALGPKLKFHSWEGGFWCYLIR